MTRLMRRSEFREMQKDITELAKVDLEAGYYGYNIHESHRAVNVEDVTVLHDWLCMDCDMSDEQLSQPCTNPATPRARHIFRKTRR